MTGKSLFFSLFVLFALSAAYLFSVNERRLDPDTGKSWWSIAFLDPKKESSLSFVISNHTATDQFRYIISTDDKTLAEGEIKVEPKNNMTYVPTVDSSLESGRITITVTHEDREETIYRSL